ncbi:alanine racemase [Phyllobacterium endophyticum]|nr:alanine racemase [Phyllobacterium endophyticum]MBB3236689.1 alanine racemase [Phyllobacterium endophyticum]
MKPALMPLSGICGADHATAAMLRGNWYEIDLDAIRHNYRQLRGQLPRHVKVYACLKRNAYGCGAGPVACALAKEDVDGFAVASVLDAVAIRQEGVSHPLLLYPGALPVAAPTIQSLDLTVSVSSVDELEQWRATITRPRIFIKVDLGFFRAGATPFEACKLLARAAGFADVQVEGIYAHMSELPTTHTSNAKEQLDRMHAILREASVLGLRPAVVMMSSTEGVLNHPEMDFDAVDPGALFFGLPDSDRPTRPVMLRPALKTISASLVSVKRLDASLGPVPGIFGVNPGMTLGVIGMGWGDGFPRDVPRGAVGLIRGKRARLLPPAHLEHIRIDLTDVPDARFGDEVVLLGRQGNQSITHEEVATLWGTDIVGLYAQLRDHIPRIYAAMQTTKEIPHE